MEIQNIKRHPMVDARIPPKSEQRPDPPQEPMDQKLTALCRAAPR